MVLRTPSKAENSMPTYALQWLLGVRLKAEYLLVRVVTAGPFASIGAYLLTAVAVEGPSKAEYLRITGILGAPLKP